MDSLNSPSSTSTPEALARELRTLRLSLQIALVSLVILSAAIGLYLFRQVQLLRRQTEFSTRTADQMAKNYTMNMATQAVDFERQLLEFARTHPDFHARLAKFYPTGVPAPTPPSSTPPSSTPATPPSSTPPSAAAPVNR